MATGQGTTWVLVADARQARVLEVEDAGLPPRLLTKVPAPPAEGRPHPPEHGWTRGPDPRSEHEHQRLVKALVQMLEHGEAENRFRHLVLVAPPHLLGHLRDGLPPGLAKRLRKSLAKDWAHLPDAEVAEQARPLVEIWPP